MISLICNQYTAHPAAIARIHGGEDFPAVGGTVSFCPVRDGIIVSADIHGLPTKNICHSNDIFGFHIHEGSSCTGDGFPDTGKHFDRDDSLHPYHTGDLPPLFANQGRAYMEFLTDSFSIADILGRTVIIHQNADDLTSQPSGNAGKKIACGKILRCCCR